MKLSDRIKKIVEHSELSIPQFANKIGVQTPQAIRDLISGKTRSLSEDMQSKILSYIPSLNAAWLFTGEGEMLNNSQPAIIDTALNKDNPRMIPFYDAETTGGHKGLVSSSNENSSLRGYIDAGDWFDGRETAAIRHVGDSMIEYPDGCILAVREVRERRLLIPGRNYVIETNEYRVTKRVQKGPTNEYLTLYSTNQEKYDDGRLIHEPFDVYIEDIRRIFSILGYIVNQAGETRLIKAF